MVLSERRLALARPVLAYRGRTSARCISHLAAAARGGALVATTAGRLAVAVGRAPSEVDTARISGVVPVLATAIGAAGALKVLVGATPTTDA